MNKCCKECWEVDRNTTNNGFCCDPSCQCHSKPEASVCGKLLGRQDTVGTYGTVLHGAGPEIWCNEPNPCPFHSKPEAPSERLQVGEILADFEADHDEVKAVNSIYDLLAQVREATQRETLGGFQNYLLKHGYCDADVYAEPAPGGHENAIAGYLASLQEKPITKK